MPFQKGNQVGVQFTSDYQPETNGRPEGVRNRSTVAREVLSLARALPENLVVEHAKLGNALTIEEVMALVQAEKAIQGDTNAYKALMDSAYGAPKQAVGGEGDDEPIKHSLSLTPETIDAFNQLFDKRYK